jgi:predicted phosphoadenosine phosphosulfate sulfurtransferase
LEVRHFSYFNLLEQDEYYICWDSQRKNGWVRQPPSFAIFDHPVCKSRIDRYQQFLERHNADGVVITGVRMAESLQRSKYMTNSFSAKIGLARGNMVWAIYDFKDSDVWRYLYEQNIDILEVYLYMYQVGIRLNALRVSQFFSVDTAKSLVKLNEYYPDLMDRVIRREPNAYLAALYWDSEMFKHSSKTRKELEDKRGFKADVYKLLSNPSKNFVMESSLENTDRIIKLLIKYGPIISDRLYRSIYDCLIAGDPKQRTLRAIITQINYEYTKAYRRVKTNGK